MIPKTIHYCWFGGNPKPELALKCIKSWEKRCKGYELVEWNEDTFDISTAPLYVRQAYEAKKWAFVTDYVRLYAMFNYGGIYMDTDVEVVKPLDAFLHHKAFSGFEDERNIPTGIMACEKGFPLFKEFLDYYNDAELYDENGNITYITNVTIMTNICLKRGLVQNNTFQEIEGFALYPKCVFCPIDADSGLMKKNRETTTIHWFAGSWHSEEMKTAYRQHWRYVQETRRAERADYITHIPNRVLRRVFGNSLYEKIKRVVRR